MSTRRSFALDSSNNLVVTAGNFTFVSDGPSIVQDIRLRLGLFLGEWFLDEAEGIPYFQEILVKNPNTAQIRRRFSDRIAGTPGVESVDEITLTLNRQTRELLVNFKVATDVGLLTDTVNLSLAF